MPTAAAVQKVKHDYGKLRDQAPAELDAVYDQLRSPGGQNSSDCERLILKEDRLLTRPDEINRAEVLAQHQVEEPAQRVDLDAAYQAIRAQADMAAEVFMAFQAACLEALDRLMAADRWCRIAAHLALLSEGMSMRNALVVQLRRTATGSCIVSRRP